MIEVPVIYEIKVAPYELVKTALIDLKSVKMVLRIHDFDKEEKQDRCQAILGDKLYVMIGMSYDSFRLFLIERKVNEIIFDQSHEGATDGGTSIKPVQAGEGSPSH